MIQNSCLEEDWKKNFRKSENEFLKLVDEPGPFVTPDPRSPRTWISAEKKRENELKDCAFFDCLRRTLLI